MATQLAPLPTIPSAHTLGIHDIARRLGIYYRHTDSAGATRPSSVATIVTYIDGLVDHFNFPRPFPVRERNGKWRETTHPHSRWQRVAVEAWFYDRLPPETAAQVEALELDQAAKRIDRNAELLFAPANDRAAA